MIDNLLYAKSVRINDKISVMVPTIGEIISDEAAYNGAVSAVIATPSDYMVQLDDVGIDFAEISSFELFLLLFELSDRDGMQLIFGDMDLTKFSSSFNPENGERILVNSEDGIVIDRAVHAQIAAALKRINHIESHNKKPANEDAKKFMLERARVKMQRAAKRRQRSQLEDLIIALVNTEQFKYGYDGVLDLTVYQFYASLYQIIRKINYDNTMIGCYAGTISAKELNQDQLNWFIPTK